MPETSQLKLSCLCGAAKHSFNVPTNHLPLATNLCSCDISRRTSGCLLTSYFPITTKPDDTKPDTSALTAYRSSNILKRHFCSTCGTHMYLEYDDDGHFEAATGTLNMVEGIVEIRSHMWIGDTKDGGAADLITDLYGKPVTRYKTEQHLSEEELPLGWSAVATGSQSAHREDRLRARCHCGGVQFSISRPTEDSRRARDLFHELYKPTDSHDGEKFWFLPEEGKFSAGPCSCTSCRKAAGFEVAWWACVPSVNIILKNERPFDRKEGSYWGTIRSYQSSAKVLRTFCSICGCNIFWEYDIHGNPGVSIVDIAAGLLDAGSGARAEDWFVWAPGVNFEGDSVNKPLTDGLVRGLKRWNEGRMKRTQM